MKLIRLIVGCLLIAYLGMPFVNAGQSQYRHVTSIYMELQRAVKVKLPPLHVVTTNEVFAQTSETSIEISTGMLKMANNAELAGILGHEITHYMHKDYLSNVSSFKELRADREGLGLAQEIGYKKCNILNFMLKMKKKYGDIGDNAHPNWSVRHRLLGKNC
jgi:hypothetical protein